MKHKYMMIDFTKKKTLLFITLSALLCSTANATSQIVEHNNPSQVSTIENKDLKLIGALKSQNGDDHAAAEWFLKSAKDGDANAQYELGTILSTFGGEFLDLDEGFKWISRSAEQGDASSKEALETMRANGNIS